MGKKFKHMLSKTRISTVLPYYTKFKLVQAITPPHNPTCDITLQEQRSKVRESEKLLFFKTLTSEKYARAQYVDCIKNKPEKS